MASNTQRQDGNSALTGGARVASARKPDATPPTAGSDGHCEAMLQAKAEGTRRAKDEAPALTRPPRATPTP